MVLIDEKNKVGSFFFVDKPKMTRTQCLEGTGVIKS